MLRRLAQLGILLHLTALFSHNIAFAVNNDELGSQAGEEGDDDDGEEDDE